MMNRRSKEIMTMIVVAATVILIIGFIATVILFKTEEIDKDQFTVISFFLSTTLTTMVIIYAVLVTSNRSASEQYLDYLKKGEQSDDGSTSDESRGSPSDSSVKNDKID